MKVFQKKRMIKPPKVLGNICLVILQKKTTKSSNSNFKTSQEIQKTLHRPPLFHSKQISDGSSKLHIKCSCAPVRRRLSASNLSQCHIRGRLLFYSPSRIDKLTYIYSSVTERHNDQ
jgi:hypothetical protein